MSNPNYIVSVLSVSASHFQMPSAIVKVTQEHLGEKDTETVLVRLGGDIDCQKLFSKKKSDEPQ